MSSKHEAARGRTGAVIIITLATMVAEVVAGWLTGSMALLADGWHMATHAGAMAITWGSYHLADDPKFRGRFTFGGGKILSLGAYTSALMLILAALWMAGESVWRFWHPHDLKPVEAILVTSLGLLVNLLSIWLLGGHDHGHGGHEHHHHDHGPRPNRLAPAGAKAGCGHDHSHGHDHKFGRDLNMESAYAHVFADALTSVLALGALAAAYLWGINWLDPAVGVLGAVMILRWGMDLVKRSGHELLDGRASQLPTDDIEVFLRERGLKTSCVHVWQVDGAKLAAHLRVHPGARPLPAVEELRGALLSRFKIDHLLLELSSGDGQDCPLEH